MLSAPSADQFLTSPRSWYVFAASKELTASPVARELLGKRLVAYRTSAGVPVILDGRCAHLGADLGQGQVAGECLRCPFHGWEYGPDGRCVRIPASGQIPPFARIDRYPTLERHGLVFFFNGPEPLFPLPFFEGHSPDDFLAARPFEAVLNCPWYLVGANAFDVQHFRAAHDRRLLGDVQLDQPAPFAQRITGLFAVAGRGLGDRLTRRLAGDRVRLTFTDWGGTIVLMTAAFERSTSYSMVFTRPLGPDRCLVQVVVLVPRRGRGLLRRLCDSLNLRARRTLIRRFLTSDAILGRRGLSYNPLSLTDSDRILAEHFTWLASTGVRNQESGARSQGAGVRSQESVKKPLTPDPCPLTPDQEAPPAGCFSAVPAAWFLFGRSREVPGSGPFSKDLLGRRLVAYRTPAGKVVVLDALCPHMGTDLGRGEVDGDVLRCPFHGWEFGPDGRCVRTPGCDDTPGFARLNAYPTAERHGLIFFWNGPEPLYPLPFFQGAEPDDFVAARPFGIVLNCPWYMVHANAFDAQHFRGVHDRQMVGDPVVEQPAPFLRRARAVFKVLGHSWRDRVTAWFGGATVELAGDDYSGTLIFVTATFRRTRSYGLITTAPVAQDRALVRGIVFVRRSRTRLGRLLLDPLHGEVRRYFIAQFLKADAQLALQGYRYDPSRFLPADAELAGYYRWLAAASHGMPASEGIQKR
jgi:phenylpropionate dioxygenase-like ring-hydroxylating dioxygenase large terminal subunit